MQSKQSTNTMNNKVVLTLQQARDLKRSIDTLCDIADIDQIKWVEYKALCRQIKGVECKQSK